MIEMIVEQIGMIGMEGMIDNGRDGRDGRISMIGIIQNGIDSDGVGMEDNDREWYVWEG